MKNIIITITLCVSVLLSISPTFAIDSYTQDEVSKHNVETDCWMIFENGVYDITAYVRQHDKYMEITSWCGQDMTVDFQTKAGTGQDHKNSSYSLLASYYVGDISAETVPVVEEIEEVEEVEEEVVEVQEVAEVNEKTVMKNPYNMAIPLFSTIILYTISYLFMKKGQNVGKSRQRFNLLWNTALVFSLIPSVVFGLYLILRYSIPALAQVNFDFLYWHVEGSIVFSTLVCLHLILRFSQYLVQCKSLRKQ